MSMPRDFNEEIVSSYFELQGYFVRLNVPYQPADDKNLSDIDVVALNPLDDSCIACEVKGWHSEPGRFSMSYWKDWPKLLNFAGPAAMAALRELVGNRTLHYVLVIPPISEKQRAEVVNYARERNVELLEWPVLIEKMLMLVDVGRNARNLPDHMLRVLLRYGFADPNLR